MVTIQFFGEGAKKFGLKRSEVRPPVESAHQQNKACPRSRVVPRLEEPDLIGGKRSLLLSFSLIDLLAIQQKSLDRASFLYISIREVRLNGVRASIAIHLFN